MPRADPPDELLARCRAGDREAFGRLFDLFGNRVYAIAYGLCGDEATAADVSQEVFMKLLTRIGQFDARASFSTWLYRIVVNTTMDHHRAAQHSVELSAELEDGRRHDEDFAREEQRRRIERAVRALPVKLRAPIVLRHIEGLSYSEIAAVLRISMGTVASRLSRAHAQLARQLEGEV